MTFARDVDAYERWQRRQDSYQARPRANDNRWRSSFKDEAEYWAMTPEQRSLARIEAMKKRLEKDRYNVYLKKRLKRLERLHAQRNLLGWRWLLEHPEHPLAPGHNDWREGRIPL